MYKILNNKAPPYLTKLFKSSSENFNYSLRGRNQTSVFHYRERNVEKRVSSTAALNFGMD